MPAFTDASSSRSLSQCAMGNTLPHGTWAGAGATSEAAENRLRLPPQSLLFEHPEAVIVAPILDDETSTHAEDDDPRD